MREKKDITLDAALFLVLVADILFAPFLLPVPVPISFAILPIWIFTLRSVPQARVFVPACIGAAFAVLSYVYGLERIPSINDLAVERMANTAIVVFMFGAYVMMMTTRMWSFNRVIQLLRIYLIFLFILAVIFFINSSAYFAVRNFWSFKESVEIVSDLNILTRFTGTMSDPNNLAVSTCAITALLVLYQESKIWLNLIAMALTAVIVVASMSVTGVICYALLAATYVLGSKLPPLTRIALLMAAAITGLAIFFAIRETEVFRLATERVMDSDTDSRLSRWAVAMNMDKFIASIILGDGGTIFMNNFEYRPHNGHIHLIYSFGVFCYLAFISIFFRIRRIADWRHYLFLVILFIGFTVNVGIYEHRFAGVWVILMVIYHQVSAASHIRQRRVGLIDHHNQKMTVAERARIEKKVLGRRLTSAEPQPH
ncbi:hypothetical protein [Sphingopyxis sp. NJF-3]